MSGHVVALTGGIGGAKLALGLSRVLAPENLTLIVNTGDDFFHLGLAISPDVDTTLYTLAGLADTEKGWGRAEESWNFLSTLKALGSETWFQLGDKDLALHVERTRRLAAGETLSTIIADFARHLGVGAKILPMSDDPVRTEVETDEGRLAFQDYFVRRRCGPKISRIFFTGAAAARINPAAAARLADPGTAAIILCPSNPWLSMDPILAVPGYRTALMAARAPVIAVTPVIGGRAVKGPTAKIMAELGIDISPLAIAAHYGDLLDGFLLDRQDAALAEEFSLPTRLSDTLMLSLEDRMRVATDVLAFAREFLIR